MDFLVEIRSYRLKHGAFPVFDRLFREAALPLLEAVGIDVVAFGGSPDDPDAAFLIRAFTDLADRARQEDAFYASEAWRSGPREAVLECIVTYLDTLMTLDGATVAGLRTLGLSANVA